MDSRGFRSKRELLSKYQLYLPSKEELKRQLEEAAGLQHPANPDQQDIDAGQ